MYKALPADLTSGVSYGHTTVWPTSAPKTALIVTAQDEIVRNIDRMADMPSPL